MYFLLLRLQVDSTKSCLYLSSINLFIYPSILSLSLSLSVSLSLIHPSVLGIERRALGLFYHRAHPQPLKLTHI
jgi:hypothetical protein